MESDNFKILWDFTIQCDPEIEARRRTVSAEENGLANDVQTSTNKPLFVSVKNEGLLMNEEAETAKQLKERKKSDRLEG